MSDLIISLNINQIVLFFKIHWFVIYLTINYVIILTLWIVWQLWLLGQKLHLHFIQSLNLYPIDFCIDGSSKKKLLNLPPPQEEIDLVCVWLSDEIQKALISWHLGCRRRSFHFSRIFLRACYPRNTLLSLSRAKSREVIISRGGMHQGKERVGA